MKGLYRKLAAIYLVSAVMFFLFFFVCLFISGRSEKENFLSPPFGKVEKKYIRSFGENRKPGLRVGEGEKKKESSF